MTIKELMYNHSHPIFTDDELLQGDLIAMDGKDGKILFDTHRNKSEYVKKYYEAEITSIWADCRKIQSTFGDYFKPVMKCYVSHDSWKVEENNNGRV